MAVKLALNDKQEILRLYRESDATTTQLAKQFGISTSTVLRLLQELIPAEEYRQLVSQKKAEGKRGSRISHEVVSFQVNQLALIPDDLSMAADDRNHNFDQGDETAIAMDDLDETLDITDSDIEEELDDDDDEAEDDLVDEDNLEDLGEDELEDFADEDSESSLPMFAELSGGHSLTESLEILPLDRADLPLICYIVVDRIAEIITRPLKDFKDLGAIPPEESMSKTIPIFDNHRVARRFSYHNQRVIKFPSNLIHITRPQLVQKGITRILFSGQVYTLN
ncbi:helix-turn-helix domain-containing protein [Pseudanabaena mucicola]|uniref:Transposase n=1 Tax=Pseudanabaena mucicola FACHB-723 TaxID=2692860 RepID=A0ABR7ZYW1_9CYAN|nr:helix-turn-helix domain-containing protein [Pseudanabaena mucicola]MBD2189010.1 transposase [Pseudanabaena mucicola FACHB-723]